MIIDKSTSDALLVNSLRVFGSSGKPLPKVKSFNTDTLEATKEDDSTETCVDFAFYINITDEAAVIALVGDPLKTKVVPGHKTAHGQGPSSMVYTGTDPNHLFTQESPLGVVLLKCSNCSTAFVAFLDRAGDLWSTARAVAADKHLTATKLDKSALVCDSCSESVTLAED